MKSTLQSSANRQLQGQEFICSEDFVFKSTKIQSYKIDSKISTNLSAIGRYEDDGYMDGLSKWWNAYFDGEIPENIHVKRGDSSIRIADLFCGIGGFSKGIQQLVFELGYRPKFELAVDSDVGALNTYMANFNPTIAIGSDIQNLVDYRVRGQGLSAEFSYDPEIISERVQNVVSNVDIVVAGPPCQGHSNLNNHSRRTDSRNYLYLTVPAFAIASGAKAVVIENVVGIVKSKNEVVDSAISLLQQNGYSVETGVLAADEMGWPQTRKRHFLVARRNGSEYRPPLKINVIQEALSDKITRSVMWAIGGDITLSPQEFMHEVPNYSTETQSRLNWFQNSNEHNLPLSKRPQCHRDGTSYKSVYGRMRANSPAPTITSGYTTPGQGRFIHPTEPRTLTPAEAARLQGFPRNHIFIGKNANIPNRGELAKWIGDAVPMPLGYAAGLSVLAPAYATKLATTS